MKELLTILLLWFLFETDEEVIEPLQALAADLTALELEVECGLPRRLTAHRSNEFQNILDHVTDPKLPVAVITNRSGCFLYFLVCDLLCHSAVHKKIFISLRQCPSRQRY